jgi:hypothetical protein
MNDEKRFDRHAAQARVKGGLELRGKLGIA